MDGKKAIELRARAWKEFAMRQNPELDEQEAWKWALEFAEWEYANGVFTHCVIRENDGRERNTQYEENGAEQERPPTGRDDENGVK